VAATASLIKKFVQCLMKWIHRLMTYSYISLQHEEHSQVASSFAATLAKQIWNIVVPLKFSVLLLTV
jgi:hypothetical protein